LEIASAIAAKAGLNVWLVIGGLGLVLVGLILLIGLIITSKQPD